MVFGWLLFFFLVPFNFCFSFHFDSFIMTSCFIHNEKKGVACYKRRTPTILFEQKKKALTPTKETTRANKNAFLTIVELEPTILTVESKQCRPKTLTLSMDGKHSKPIIYSNFLPSIYKYIFGIFINRYKQSTKRTFF